MSSPGFRFVLVNTKSRRPPRGPRGLPRGTQHRCCWERFDWGSLRQRPSVAASMRRAGSVRVQCAECLAAAGMLSEQASAFPADIYVSIASRGATQVPRCTLLRVAQNR